MLKAGFAEKKKNRINTVALTLIFLHTPTCLVKILICQMQCEHETKGYWKLKMLLARYMAKKQIDEVTKLGVLNET